MMKRIIAYLHIGANKTGTSAIQKYCNGQREQLASQGLLYPRAGCSGEAHYRLSDALGFTHRRLNPGEIHSLQDGILSQLRQELQETRPQCLLFSSEDFILNGDPSVVEKFFNEFDVRGIVVYLRRHDTWWNSAYNQAVRHVRHPKWGWGLQEFVRWQRRYHSNYGNWRWLVDRWAAVFGKERLIVRPFEKQQNQPNIVADLFGAIGRADLAPQEVPVVNTSLDAWSLRMIDIAQRADLDEATRQRIIAYTLRNPKGGPPLRAPAAYLRQLIEHYQSDYEYIAREYLGRKDGRLFYDPLPDDRDDVEPFFPLRVK